MLRVTDALHDALVRGGEAQGAGLSLGGGAGVCEHHYGWAPEARTSALQLGPFCLFLGGNRRGNDLWVQLGDAYQFLSRLGNFIVSVASNHVSGQ